jgi:hypothetical protein
MAGELVAWLALLLAHGLLPWPCASAAVDRGQFPDGFLFGTSTSAYQVHASIYDATVQAVSSSRPVLLLSISARPGYRLFLLLCKGNQDKRMPASSRRRHCEGPPPAAAGSSILWSGAFLGAVRRSR